MFIRRVREIALEAEKVYWENFETENWNLIQTIKTSIETAATENKWSIEVNGIEAQLKSVIVKYFNREGFNTNLNEVGDIKIE